jgi:hypothetical protein
MFHLSQSTTFQNVRQACLYYLPESTTDLNLPLICAIYLNGTTQLYARDTGLDENYTILPQYGIQIRTLKCCTAQISNQTSKDLKSNLPKMTVVKITAQASVFIFEI